MSKTVLYLAGRIQSREMKELESMFNVLRLSRECNVEEVLKNHQQDIVAVITSPNKPVSRALMEALPNLEIISLFAVGYDNIDLDAARERQIRVTNTPDLVTECTADTALSLFMSVHRRIVEADMFVRVGKFGANAFPLGVSPRGKTVGIVGLGRIGRAIAKRLEPLGCKIVYHGRAAKDDAPYPFYPDLIKMAQDCDTLMLSCTGGNETFHMINKDVLAALGEDGFLINVARGSVVDEVALVAALENKVIAGAGLDVYADEPNVPEALKTMDRVVLLPHIGSATVETFDDMGKLVLSNLKAHFSGDPLITPVV